MTELQRRFLELRQHPETVIINYPGEDISSNPLYSKRYDICNGVVLLAEGIAGLTHYDSLAKPESYLNRIIDRMEYIRQFPNGAVVVGGDKRHFDRNLKVLGDRGIPVLNHYHDGSDDVPLLTEEVFKTLRIKKSEDNGGLKDILVVPETREVIMYRHLRFNRPEEFISLN